MSLGKISNLLNIDFEICLTHDDNEFTYSLSIMISKISRIEILHAFLDQFPVMRILRNRESSNVIRIDPATVPSYSQFSVLPSFSYSLSFFFLPFWAFVTHHGHEIVSRPTVKVDHWSRVSREVPGSRELWLASVTKMDLCTLVIIFSLLIFLTSRPPRTGTQRRKNRRGRNEHRMGIKSNGAFTETS